MSGAGSPLYVTIPLSTVWLRSIRLPRWAVAFGVAAGDPER